MTPKISELRKELSSKPRPKRNNWRNRRKKLQGGSERKRFKLEKLTTCPSI